MPTTLNRYNYALNNPIIYRDPSGKFVPIIAYVLGAIATTLTIAAKGALVGGAIAGALHLANGGELDKGFVKAIFVGASIGAGSALGVHFIGGSIIGFGGFKAGSFAFKAAKVLGAGIGGGLGADAVGLKFGDGFAAGAVGQLLGAFDFIRDSLFGTKAHAPTGDLPQTTGGDPSDALELFKDPAPDVIIPMEPLG